MMKNSATLKQGQIKKLHLEATVHFAISHIPSVDQPTLEKYLELVNIDGNFGTISEAELLEKMELVMRFIPNACDHSLRTLGELLGARFPVAVENSKIVGTISPSNTASERRVAWQH